MNPQRRRPRRQKIVDPIERARALELKEALAEPSLAWMEYLRQEPWDRYSPDKTLNLARAMSRGAGDTPLFCSGMAYAETALFSAANYHNLIAEAKTLTKRAYHLTDSKEQKLYYAPRLYCMPLYAMPHIEPRISEDQLDTMLARVNDPLDEILKIVREVYQKNGQNPEYKSVLRGATTELSVLRALQRPDIIRSEFVALPAFPWEERSLRKYDLFITKNVTGRETYVMPIEGNRNYDIGVVSLKDPLQVIPLQIKTSDAHDIYHDFINVVTGPQLSGVVCKELDINYQPFPDLMNRCTQEDREIRYKIIGDYLIDEVLKIS